MTKRLDLLLLEKKIASTRTKAQALIRAGHVYVNGKPAKKCGDLVNDSAEITVNTIEYPYVSRGGLKLEAALNQFDLIVNEKRCLDIGLSTGGFAHCLLLQGAAMVVGVDVGVGQVAEELQKNPRLRIFEKCDFRKVTPAEIGSDFEFFTMDVSFISVSHLIEPLKKFLAAKAEGICLVKPQFELQSKDLGSGGIVRDAQKRDNAVSRVLLAFTERGFSVRKKISSPILGGDGNKEFLVHLVFEGEP